MSERLPWALAAAGLGFAVVGLYVWRKGGIAPAAAAVGGAAVEAVSGVTSGAVGAVGSTVGLPPPDETVRDPAVVRWIIDNAGQLSASAWGSAWAYLRAQTMAAGSGTPPALNTPAGNEFKYLIAAANWTEYTNDENARLLSRYPAPRTAAPAPAYQQWVRGPKI